MKKTELTLEIEVPGTPEQVWQAIATGPGITAWFVPTELETRESGAVTFHMGLGEDSPATVTAWQRPARFAYLEELPSADKGDPARLATEFHVEARAGGTCIVRLVTNVFGQVDGWDDELDGLRKGWTGYLGILRLYLTHFPGERCGTIQLMGRGGRELFDALGLSEASLGRPAHSRGPAFSGLVEKREADEIVLRIREPAPGIALAAFFSYQGRDYAKLCAWFYGEDAPGIAARLEPAWRAWMDERFPG